MQAEEPIEIERAVGFAGPVYVEPTACFLVGRVAIRRHRRERIHAAAQQHDDKPLVGRRVGKR